jgi:hypothetical protein
MRNTCGSHARIRNEWKLGLLVYCLFHSIRRTALLKDMTKNMADGNLL